MEQEPHISFRFQNTLFVVAAAEMHSVLPVPELTVVPEQAACVSGVFNLRGVTVPVINLSEQLGRPDGSVQLADRVLLLNGSRGPLGILANEVLDMKLISTADLVPVPDFDESVALRLATRMARLGAQIGWLLRYGELWPLLAAQQQPADTGALRFAPAGGLDALAVFRQRAAALRPQAAAAATAKPLGLAVVTINHEYYGLELDLVREFCELGSVATVPCCPAHIVGNMNLRGEILTVVDIRHALRLPAATQDGGHSSSVVVITLPEFTAGLLVDAVIAVLYIDPQHCHPAPVTQSSGSSFISGTAAFDDHELCILNISVLLRHGGIIVNEPAQSAPDATPAVHKQPTNIAVGAVTGTTAASMAAAQVDALRPGAGKVAALHAQVSMLLKQVEQLVGFWEESMRGTRDAVAQSDNLKKQQVQNLEQLGATLGQLRGSTYNNNAQLSVLVRDLTVHIHALGMLPLSSIFSRLPRMLHGIARSLSKDVKLVMAGGELTADMHTCEELADVIKHILRHVVENSLELPAQRVRAGKPATATIHLQARQTTTRLIVEITDDGAGLNEPAIKHMGLRKNLLRAEDANATPTCAASEPQVLQGLNATDAGMDAARAAVLRLNGSLQVQSTPGSGSVIAIQLPIGTATTPVIVVRVGNHSYAIPSAAVETTRLVTANDILIMAGHETIRENRQPVSVVMLEELLMLRQAHPVAQVRGSAVAWPCIIMQSGAERLGVLVDSVAGVQDVAVIQHSPILERVRTVGGSAILGTGEVCIVLHPADLFAAARARATEGSGVLGGSAVASVELKPE